MDRQRDTKIYSVCVRAYLWCLEVDVARLKQPQHHVSLCVCLYLCEWGQHDCCVSCSVALVHVDDASVKQQRYHIKVAVWHSVVQSCVTLHQHTHTWPDLHVTSICTSITPSLFHSRLKTYLFHKSNPRSFSSPSRTASTDFCLDRFFRATRFLFLFFPYFFVFGPCTR